MHGIEAPAAGPVVLPQTLFLVPTLMCPQEGKKGPAHIPRLKSMSTANVIFDLGLLLFQLRLLQKRACFSATNAGSPIKRTARQVRLNAVQAAQPEYFHPVFKKRPLGPFDRPVSRLNLKEHQREARITVQHERLIQQIAPKSDTPKRPRPL
ncbi:hypothetical protein Baya_13845 [Bagarius yarrelli]|uniref:Uncharacterized protein n=1 Tax=Bagarius yarrelli TaxID=175774 RepID=A0A556V722_BAGYA|nr:hypothetical protein Baya_13845 [Bagarius yarrelli]